MRSYGGEQENGSNIKSALMGPLVLILRLAQDPSPTLGSLEYQKLPWSVGADTLQCGQAPILSCYFFLSLRCFTFQKKHPRYSLVLSEGCSWNHILFFFPRYSFQRPFEVHSPSISTQLSALGAWSVGTASTGRLALASGWVRPTEEGSQGH